MQGTLRIIGVETRWNLAVLDSNGDCQFIEQYDDKSEAVSAARPYLDQGIDCTIEQITED